MGAEWVPRFALAGVPSRLAPVDAGPVEPWAVPISAAVVVERDVERSAD